MDAMVKEQLCGYLPDENTVLTVLQLSVVNQLTAIFSQLLKPTLMSIVRYKSNLDTSENNLLQFCIDFILDNDQLISEVNDQAVCLPQIRFRGKTPSNNKIEKSLNVKSGSVNTEDNKLQTLRPPKATDNIYTSKPSEDINNWKELLSNPKTAFSILTDVNENNNCAKHPSLNSSQNCIDLTKQNATSDTNKPIAQNRQFPNIQTLEGTSQKRKRDEHPSLSNTSTLNQRLDITSNNVQTSKPNCYNPNSQSFNSLKNEKQSSQATTTDNNNSLSRDLKTLKTPGKEGHDHNSLLDSVHVRDSTTTQSLSKVSESGQSYWNSEYEKLRLKSEATILIGKEKKYKKYLEKMYKLGVLDPNTTEKKHHQRNPSAPTLPSIKEALGDEKQSIHNTTFPGASLLVNKPLDKVPEVPDAKKSTSFIDFVNKIVKDSKSTPETSASRSEVEPTDIVLVSSQDSDFTDSQSSAASAASTVSSVTSIETKDDVVTVVNTITIEPPKPFTATLSNTTITSNPSLTSAGVTSKSYFASASVTPKANITSAGVTPKANITSAGVTPKANFTSASVTPKANITSASVTPKSSTVTTEANATCTSATPNRNTLTHKPTSINSVTPKPIIVIPKSTNVNIVTQNPSTSLTPKPSTNVTPKPPSSTVTSTASSNPSSNPPTKAALPPSTITSKPDSPQSIMTSNRKEVLQLFPDADPNYIDGLLLMHTGINGVNNVCSVLIDNPNYPRKSSPIIISPEKESPTNKINYYKDYIGRSSKYHNLCESAQCLGNEFRMISMKDIYAVTSHFQRAYAPSHRVLSKAYQNALAGQKDPYGRFNSIVVYLGEDCSKPYVCKLLKTKRGFKYQVSFSTELQKEINFVKYMNEQEKIIADSEIARKLNEDQYEETGDSIECGCCYGEQPFENMVQCYDGHLFCKDCLKSYVREAVFGSGKVDLTCMTDDCDSRYPTSQLQCCLEEDVLKKYQDRVREENLNLAGLEDLVRCPNCDYAAIMDPGDKVFRCQNIHCLMETCRFCRENWKDHIGIPCEELEKKDETTLRKEYEEKMTEAKVRTCHQCKSPFMKEEGCNKMTCRCGHTMCYICRKPSISYNHFCQHPRDPGFDCKKCKACSLWSNPEEDDKRAVLEIQLEAQKLRREKGFSDDKLIGGTAEEPPAKKARTS